MSYSDPNKPFTIFFSHRAGRSSNAALDLVAAVEGFSRGRIVAHCSAHFGLHEQWSDDAQHALHSSDWLILLFADKSIEWDWWLWELGYFTATAMRPNQRTLCLHHPGIDLPAPLRRWRPRPATPQEAHTLLVSIFKDDPLAIRPDLFNPEKESILSMLIGLVLRCCAVHARPTEDHRGMQISGST